MRLVSHNRVEDTGSRKVRQSIPGHGADAVPSEPAPSRVRARTRARLLDAAIESVQSGVIPGVAEVATRAGVSRATAYRYFPSRGALVSALVEQTLGPVRERAQDEGSDPAARLRALFDKTFPRFQQYEAQMRAALQLSLEHWARERAGSLEEEPYRRGHRAGILGHAAEPLAERLPPRTVARLVRALSLVYGIEAYVVLKDIWGADNREVEEVARWMLEALIAAAFREAGSDAAADRRARPVSRSRADPTARRSTRGR